MILILSQDVFELTTECVQDWIAHLGGDSIRFNGEDLTSASPFAMHLGADNELLVFETGGRRFTSAEVGAVWFRRWHTLRDLDYLESGGVTKVGREIRDHLISEIRAVTRGLQTLLRDVEWLTLPGEMALNKLEVLSRAAQFGIETPATIVTNDKAQLQAFRARNGGRIIAKPASQATQFALDNKLFAMYTSEVTDDDLSRAPARFFPTLAQQLIEKSFEIRTFFLGHQHWSMAIFSQRDTSTRLDFRRYNRAKPNRAVPYTLPDDLAGKLRVLVDSLKLTTGSIDLIRTPDRRHVLLEINPVGQFGMVSQPCNYRLEKKVAEYLLEVDQRHGRRRSASA